MTLQLTGTQPQAESQGQLPGVTRLTSRFVYCLENYNLPERTWGGDCCRSLILEKGAHGAGELGPGDSRAEAP